MTSCGDSVLHSYNVKGQYFDRYKATIDKKTCKIHLEDMEPIDADAKSLDGLVCVTAKQYSVMKADVKAQCENENSK